jgi:hypothetical protein
MKWPLSFRPIPDHELPLFNLFYLHGSKAGPVDPTIVWGTEIDADTLEAFLRERNRHGKVLITPVHALIRATALAFEQFPEFNVRVVGRRVYKFREVNIRMAFLHRYRQEVDLMVIGPEFLISLDKIALRVWDHILQAGRGKLARDRDVVRLRIFSGFWMRRIFRIYEFLDRHFPLPVVGRLDGTRNSCATINDLSFSGAPPLQSYKPSRFPSPNDSLNLTMGAAEKKVLERNGQFISVNIISLFVRADHRLVDAHQLGRFVGCVRDLMNNPERLNPQQGGVLSATSSA